MEELISRFTLNQIVLFTIILAIAIKSLVDFLDWIRKRARQAVYEKEFPGQLAKKNEQQLKNIKQQIKNLNENINLLIQSDKDAIKYTIVKQHHYFCYDQKHIDDYSMECLERRYSHYKQEGGNSYVQDLMKELRDLPKQTPKN